MTLDSIPPELVLNVDKTQNSCVSIGRQTMAAHGSKSVPIAGVSDKENITLTFAGDFLLMQAKTFFQKSKSKPLVK